MDVYTILQYVMMIPCVLIALTFHEVSHGYMSYKLGDPTARNLGRLTLNPIKHIDPIGCICMILFKFGWAKPVPVNSRYYKKPRRDMALVAAAGPVANILLAFVAMIFVNVFETIPVTSEMSYKILWATVNFFYTLAALSVYLAVFNLIPIPPFDGSRILYVFLPAKWYFGVMKYERYIMIAFMLFIILGGSLGILSVISSFILGGMDWLISLIPIFR